MKLHQKTIDQGTTDDEKNDDTNGSPCGDFLLIYPALYEDALAELG